MFGLCSQSLYYLLITIIAEVCGLLIIGYDNWYNYFKNNYWVTIASILIYLAIIQILCYFNKSTIAWILFWITFILNIISLLVALGQKMQGLNINPNKTKEENKKKNDFDNSANVSCKSSCIETCDKMF